MPGGMVWGTMDVLVARGAASSRQAGSEQALEKTGPEGLRLYQATGTHAGSTLIGGQFPLFVFPKMLPAHGMLCMRQGGSIQRKEQVVWSCNFHMGSGWLYLVPPW